jgi:general nucleoside transport system ATP-binding protein
VTSAATTGQPAAATHAPAVRLEGITKRFPGVVANDDVHITVRRGTVHAVVGENGAGKSTLMKIVYGMQRPDEGTIEIDGQPVSFGSPAEAIAAGIGMVHQHFMLADNLTVLENVVLGAEPGSLGRLDARAARRRIKEISDVYGLGVEPDRMVEELGVGDRQRVEILKVLYRGARILILDEPTAVLVPQEVDELFGNLRDLKAEGITVLFISHKLDEVLAVADEITVIRRGTTVATVDPREVTARRLAELMVGGELPSPETRESTVRDEVVLAVAGLTVRSADGRAVLDDVSLEIRAGEVLGIAGVEGNGQAELVEAIMGLRPAAAGRVVLAGTDLTALGTRRRREAGIGFIPEDRQRQGLLLEAPLWENRILGHQTRRPNVSGPWIDRGGARADTERIVREYDVRTPTIDVAASALSGGNQQKLIVGREMSGDPVLLLAAHPTRGVDVGAQAAIWDALRAARAEGLAVLLISADLDELIGLSDTIRVILRGRLVSSADPHTVTPEELGSAMTGAGEHAGARTDTRRAGPAPVGRGPDGTVSGMGGAAGGRDGAGGRAGSGTGPAVEPGSAAAEPGAPSARGPGITGTGTTGTGSQAAADAADPPSGRGEA